MEGNELPRLVYASREKRPGFEHHKKAGAMNALVRHDFFVFLFRTLLAFNLAHGFKLMNFHSLY